MFADTFALIATRAERGRRFLPAVPEVGYGGGHARRRRALQGVDDQQHFHQAVVRRRARRLQHETVLARTFSSSSTITSPSEKFFPPWRGRGGC